MYIDILKKTMVIKSDGPSCQRSSCGDKRDLLSPYGEGGPVNWTDADYASIHEAFLSQANSAEFYNNPAERIMGETTVDKLGQVFANSKAAGIPFQVFLSQTVFQPTSGSDWLGGTSSTARPAAQIMAPYASSACNTWWRANCLGTKAGIPWNTDSWDGFHNERLKVLAAMSKGNNPIVNSGDAHGYWIAGIKEQALTGDKMVAAEFAGGSVTSQGWGDYFPTAGGPTFGYTLGPTNNPWLTMLEDGFVAANARYGEVASFHKHGSLVFHVTKESYIGNVMTVDTINGTGYHAMCEVGFGGGGGIFCTNTTMNDAHTKVFCFLPVIELS